jgi:uncharacterized protein (TIGR02996 family)
MSDPDPTLLGLLRAYYDGDTAARAALADWLEDHADDRAEVLREVDETQFALDGSVSVADSDRYHRELLLRGHFPEFS